MHTCLDNTKHKGKLQNPFVLFSPVDWHSNHLLHELVVQFELIHLILAKACHSQDCDFPEIKDLFIRLMVFYSEESEPYYQHVEFIDKVIVFVIQDCEDLIQKEKICSFFIVLARSCLYPI